LSRISIFIADNFKPTGKKQQLLADELSRLWRNAFTDPVEFFVTLGKLCDEKGDSSAVENVKRGINFFKEYSDQFGQEFAE
jgi:hypothetical protein